MALFLMSAENNKDTADAGTDEQEPPQSSTATALAAAGDLASARDIDGSLKRKINASTCMLKA